MKKKLFKVISCSILGSPTLTRPQVKGLAQEPWLTPGHRFLKNTPRLSFTASSVYSLIFSGYVLHSVLLSWCSLVFILCHVRCVSPFLQDPAWQPPVSIIDYFLFCARPTGTSPSFGFPVLNQHMTWAVTKGKQTTCKRVNYQKEWIPQLSSRISFFHRTENENRLNLHWNVSASVEVSKLIITHLMASTHPHELF